MDWQSNIATEGERAGKKTRWIKDWVAALENQIRKLQSGENLHKAKVTKEGGKTLGGCNTCTLGPHRDRPRPGLGKECFKCKQKGNFQNAKVFLKRKKAAVGKVVVNKMEHTQIPWFPGWWRL